MDAERFWGEVWGNLKHRTPAASLQQLRPRAKGIFKSNPQRPLDSIFSRGKRMLQNRSPAVSWVPLRPRARKCSRIDAQERGSGPKDAGIGLKKFWENFFNPNFFLTSFPCETRWIRGVHVSQKCLESCENHINLVPGSFKAAIEGTNSKFLPRY